MGFLIRLVLCAPLIAGSAVVAQPNIEPHGSADPQAYCVDGDGEIYPYDGNSCHGRGQLARGNCRRTDGRVVAVTKADCLATGGSIELPLPASLKPGQQSIAPPRANPAHPLSQPAYPPEAKASHHTGTVIMLLTVDKTGHVSKAALDKSSGFESLDQAALNEAKNSWQLLPGTVNGKPTAMQYKFAVTFKGTDDTPAAPPSN